MALSNFSDIDLTPLMSTMAEMRKGAEFLASGINDGELKEIADDLTRALARQEADFMSTVPPGLAASQKEYASMQREYESLSAELKDIEDRKKYLVAKMAGDAKIPASKKTPVPPLKPSMLAGESQVPKFNQSPDLLSELLNLGKKQDLSPAKPVRKTSGNIWDNWGTSQNETNQTKP